MSTVAVVGAAGHTGKFVVAELARRGIGVIAIGRDAAKLDKAGFAASVKQRVALLTDTAALDASLAGAQVVVNCAGPFMDTADEVAGASIRAKAHYIDVSAEQGSTRFVLEKYDVPARYAGVAVVPALAFFGGFVDLLATAAVGDWPSADSIEAVIGLDSWHPTEGTRETGEKNTGQRFVVRGGKLEPFGAPGAKEHGFGEPWGHVKVKEIALSEAMLIPRHIDVKELHTYLSSKALDDIHDAKTPAPVAADKTGRSAQRFIVDVVAVKRGAKTRSVRARGRDIYGFTGPLVQEAVAALLASKFADAGAKAPGEMFNAREILEACARNDETFHFEKI
jgi:Saccharopine dehydrogenase NADP binding domain